jgi:hypothetical protein
VTVIALLCLVSLGRSGAASEPSTEDVLARAQNQFRQGAEKLREPIEARRLFGEAADTFATLRGVVRSPNFFLSWGNSEALAGRWPQAIWAYHSGLRIDPNSEPLREHLQYARSLVDDTPGGRSRPEPSRWPGWLHRPTPGDLLLLTAITYSLGCFAAGWWYVRRRSLLLAAAVAFFSVALAGGAAYLLEERRAEEEARQPLVIVAAEGTTLHRGNGPSYPLHPDVPSLPPGLEARQIQQRGGWLQVELTTGEVGWVPSDRVLVVAP